MSDFEAVIGLEVHAQLSTRTKIFCSCSTLFHSEPNTNICPVCTGLPGSLPVLNEQALRFAVAMGLALNCRINSPSYFARKHYFYPDLPKGYQISQYDVPVCSNGHLVVNTSEGSCTVRINRIHLEEDAGKSIHDRGDATRIDMNRCGTPLIEIVSEPDISSPAGAVAYMQQIRQIVRYLGICDGNMEEGSLRCDANVSIRRKGDTKLGTKTELKNMNSFRHIEKAIHFEIERQTDILNAGGTIIQETLLWDETAEIARSMRSKEESHDYRYFPEPDLPSVVVTDQLLKKVHDTLPELPAAKKERFISACGLTEYEADILTQERRLAEYFELAQAFCNDPKTVSNFILGEVLKTLNEQKISIEEYPVPAEHLGYIISLIRLGTLSPTLAKSVLQFCYEEQKHPVQIIEERNLRLINDDSEIERLVAEAIQNHPDEAQQLREGKEKVLGFFTGRIMRAGGGKLNAKRVQEIILDTIHNNRNS